MDFWLNTVGYAAAVAFAFEGFLKAMADRRSRSKALFLFLLAALYAIDVFGWYWAAKALQCKPPGTYPWPMHIVDVLCIAAALFTAVQFKESESTDERTHLDWRCRAALGGFAAYALGCALYWVAMLAFVGDGEFWGTLQRAWHLEGTALIVFSSQSIALYLGTGCVTLALLWPQARTSRGHQRLRRLRGAAWAYLWWRPRGAWAVLAAWILVPLAIYGVGGPTRAILIQDAKWATGATWLFLAGFATAVSLAVAVRLARDMVPRAPRAAKTGRPGLLRISRRAIQRGYRRAAWTIDALFR